MAETDDEESIAARSMRAAEDAARNRRKSGRVSPWLWAVILIVAVALYTVWLV
ncbi:MAG: hypothetical protein P1U65_07310 [Minwuia sp.]|nr:hypothetical protein [Minwuia sp.]